jgi:hypothetical protein
MENNEFTPSESLALITKVILEAKEKFRENGFSFIYWGSCVFIASFAQFLLLQTRYYHINYYPYYIFPLASVFAFFYYKKKYKLGKSSNIISSALSVLGILMGINMMISGFFFWNKFGIALVPFMLILMAIWLMLSGVLIKNRMLMISAVVANIVGFATFYISREYHPLVMALVSLFTIVFPGLNLYFAKK